MLIICTFYVRTKSKYCYLLLSNEIFIIFSRIPYKIIAINYVNNFSFNFVSDVIFFLVLNINNQIRRIS